MLNKIKNGHIHTPFCPHGTTDTLKEYVERAIDLGFKEISFTEHMPMPKGVVEISFQNECTLQEEVVLDYLKALREIKYSYRDQIKINIGFEVDYIEGYEKETIELLNRYGNQIEDGLLSVHFLKIENQYYAVDYLPHFEALLKRLGSLETLYNLYYETLLKSVEAELGEFKPRRIGHPTLVRIFNRKYPMDYSHNELIERIVEAIYKKGYEIDFNVAGLRKVYCKETYPAGYFLELAKTYKIPMVYGSDAHCVKDLDYNETI